jgi:hypothetical protein
MAALKTSQENHKAALEALETLKDEHRRQALDYLSLDGQATEALVKIEDLEQDLQNTREALANFTYGVRNALGMSPSARPREVLERCMQYANDERKVTEERDSAREERDAFQLRAEGAESKLERARGLAEQVEQYAFELDESQARANFLERTLRLAMVTDVEEMARLRRERDELQDTLIFVRSLL